MEWTLPSHVRLGLVCTWAELLWRECMLLFIYLRFLVLGGNLGPMPAGQVLFH